VPGTSTVLVKKYYSTIVHFSIVESVIGVLGCTSTGLLLYGSTGHRCTGVPE
jgi:hypothetical protein